MPRKKLSLSLPPVRALRSRSSTTSATEHLIQRLRRLALKHQSDKPQVFYPVREVATGFRVPVSTVARIYRQFEGEGLLTRIRGSRTVLEPRATARHHLLVHAAIAIPMSLSSFLLKQKSRMFYLALKRELRRRGFLACGTFFDKAEAHAALIAERIQPCHAQIVLWYMADRLARETAELLKDMGIRTLGVCDMGMPVLPCSYQIEREKAIGRIFHDWKTRGQIDQGLIVCAGNRSGAEEEQIEDLLEAVQLPHELIAFKERRADRFLESLASRERSGIVLSGNAAALFALREPEGLMHLMRTLRVALIDGPVTLPWAGTPTCPVDLVMADWEAVASAISSDLLHKGSTGMPKVTVFPARAYLQTPLNDFAQSL